MKDGREINEVFDLNQNVKDYVARMEDCLREIAAARGDMQQLVDEAKSVGYTAKDVAAMKRYAKLRHDDKRADAVDQLRALKKISSACNYDLFADL